MTTAPVLEPTLCAICGVQGEAEEVYPASFDWEAFNQRTFSARRVPDRVHYRMVRCMRCALLRSDPVADRAVIRELYLQSTMDYDPEIDTLRATYGRYLDRLAPYQERKGSLLEIGCANGFMLDEALERGYAEVTGVEPGMTMKEKAPARVRDRIVTDLMREGLFPANSFDVICMFQVFDHLSDPASVLAECHTVLCESGLLLLFNHNEKVLSARLLGERSPIIDIEHTYLYNLDTTRRILEKNGFRVLELAPAHNLYRLRYLSRLLPLPNAIRSAAGAALDRTGLAQLQLEVSLGNLYAIAVKEDHPGNAA